MTTPSAKSCSNSRPRIMASATSVTWNSSKHRSVAVFGNAARHRRDRVVGIAALAFGMDARMGVGHEGVEMDAALGVECHGFEEQIHQHGFAAPDIAPDIQALRRRRWRAEEAALAGPVVLERLGERLQPPGGGFLQGVVLELAASHAGLDSARSAWPSGAARQNRPIVEIEDHLGGIFAVAILVRMIAAGPVLGRHEAQAQRRRNRCGRRSPPCREPATRQTPCRRRTAAPHAARH